jgi:hypothetical protein
MNKDKVFFPTRNECYNKQMFVSDIRSLSVAGSRTIQLDDIILMMYFQVSLATSYQCIKPLIQVKVKQWIFHLTKL